MAGTDGSGPTIEDLLETLVGRNRGTKHVHRRGITPLGTRKKPGGLHLGPRGAPPRGRLGGVSRPEIGKMPAGPIMTRSDEEEKSTTSGPGWSSILCRPCFGARRSNPQSRRPGNRALGRSPTPAEIKPIARGRCKGPFGCLSGPGPAGLGGRCWAGTPPGSGWARPSWSVARSPWRSAARADRGCPWVLVLTCLAVRLRARRSPWSARQSRAAWSAGPSARAIRRHPCTMDRGAVSDRSAEDTAG